MPGLFQRLSSAIHGFADSHIPRNDETVLQGIRKDGFTTDLYSHEAAEEIDIAKSHADFHAAEYNKELEYIRDRRLPVSDRMQHVGAAFREKIQERNYSMSLADEERLMDFDMDLF
jgi:hypothetical protein